MQTLDYVIALLVLNALFINGLILQGMIQQILNCKLM